MQPNTLSHLLVAGLKEQRLLLLHLCELYSNLPALLAQTTAQLDAVKAGYQAFTVQNPIGLLQSCCFLPVDIHPLLNTYPPDTLTSYLAGLTLHYLEQLPVSDFTLVPHLISFKQLCQTFSAMLALLASEAHVSQVSFFAKPVAIEPHVDSKILMQSVDKHMLDTLQPKL